MVGANDEEVRQFLAEMEAEGDDPAGEPGLGDEGDPALEAARARVAARMREHLAAKRGGKP